MSAQLTRRDSLGASLLAALTLSSDAGSALAAPPPYQSLVFVTTLAAARQRRFDASVGVVVIGGYEAPGDAGAGQILVRDRGINRQRLAREPLSGFVDMAGAGFSRASDTAVAALRQGPLLDWLVARSDQAGRNPLIDLRAGDAATAKTLQIAFNETANPDGAAAMVTRLPSGHWPIGTAQLVLDGRGASLVGQGISTTFLHSTIDGAKPALVLRNYGGVTSDFGIDSGTPGSTPADARSTDRHGILFDWSGGHGTIRSVEARWFNGYGMRFVTLWDSIVENVITVGCGNDTVHAIEFTSPGDTTNHTNVNRVQAENSQGRAILFDATCMNMCVDNIHCEGTVGRRGQYAVSLLGTAMSYRNARIANNGGNVEVLLGGAGNVYDRFSFEPGVLVDYASGATGRTERSFFTHSSMDRLRILERNRGALVVSDCTIDHLDIADQMRTTTFVRCTIGSVAVRGNQTDVTFEDCEITGTWSSEGNPVVRAHGCRLAQGPAGASIHLTGCTIRGTYASTFNQQIRTIDCRFDGDVILDQTGARIWLFGRFDVAGSLLCNNPQAFGACSLDGSVAGGVHPNWYGNGGTWPAGTLRARPDVKRGDSPFSRFDGHGWSYSPPMA